MAGIDKIPAKATTGILTIGGKDLTCHARRVSCNSSGGAETDMSTWCDPTASVSSPASRTLDIEWLNSFKGDTADLGLFDELMALADGSLQPVVFKPFGADDGHAAFACNVVIPDAPLGDFSPDAPIIVSTSWGVSDFVYTEATTT